MVLQNNRAIKASWLKQCRAFLIALAFIVWLTGPSLAESGKQQTFSSPEEAVKALVAAVKADDAMALSAILGPGSEDVVSSGDPVADKVGYEQFINLYKQKNRLEEEGTERVILSIGDEDWPFPIPIIKDAGAWRFATQEGREELLARRIGNNELSVIRVCLAFVDAQREYAFKDRNGDGFREYAQKFMSDTGKQDGLYWKTNEGEEQSPLGPLIAEAQEKGYPVRPAGSEPIPYYGYYYRILKAQGKNAPGGAYDYVVEGKMIGGFALVAYPAQYGSSGVMTFIVNHLGVVYQKDLGMNTDETASAMTSFDPDGSWKKVGETVAREP